MRLADVISQLRNIIFPKTGGNNRKTVNKRASDRLRNKKKPPKLTPRPYKLESIITKNS